MPWNSSSRSLSARILLTALVIAIPGAAAARADEKAPRRIPPEARATQPAAPSRLVWSDEFNGPAGAPPDPLKWHVVTGGNGWGNDELEYYTARSANVHLDGRGHLAIVARAEQYTGADGTRGYTSARIQTLGLFATTYGRIEARIKVPAGQGLWPAFWAMGTGHDTTAPWPLCGEIDIMESLGDRPVQVYGSIHGPAASGPDGYGLTAETSTASPLADGFHVFGVDWSPGMITFTLDGTPYATRTPASLASGQRWVFNRNPMYLLLNLAVGGSWPGPPTPATVFPATMLVDWVRVYSG